MIPLSDVYLYSVPLPMATKGCTIVTPDCTIVFINDFLSPSEKQKAIDHELKHIEYDHFYSIKSVGEVEEAV